MKTTIIKWSWSDPASIKKAEARKLRLEDKGHKLISTKGTGDHVELTYIKPYKESVMTAAQLAAAIYMGHHVYFDGKRLTYQQASEIPEVYKYKVKTQRITPTILQYFATSYKSNKPTQ